MLALDRLGWSRRELHRPLDAEGDQEVGERWGYFPAPSLSVSSVDVMMPGGFARLANVPISSAP
jgi:hypothetical protein